MHFIWGLEELFDSYPLSEHRSLEKFLSKSAEFSPYFSPKRNSLPTLIVYREDDNLTRFILFNYTLRYTIIYKPNNALGVRGRLLVRAINRVQRSNMKAPVNAKFNLNYGSLLQAEYTERELFGLKVATKLLKDLYIVDGKLACRGINGGHTIYDCILNPPPEELDVALPGRKPAPILGKHCALNENSRINRAFILENIGPFYAQKFGLCNISYSPPVNPLFEDSNMDVEAPPVAVAAPPPEPQQLPEEAVAAPAAELSQPESGEASEPMLEDKVILERVSNASPVLADYESSEDEAMVVSEIEVTEPIPGCSKQNSGLNVEPQEAQIPPLTVPSNYKAIEFNPDPLNLGGLSSDTDYESARENEEIERSKPISNVVDEVTPPPPAVVRGSEQDFDPLEQTLIDRLSKVSSLYRALKICKGPMSSARKRLIDVVRGSPHLLQAWNEKGEAKFERPLFARSFADAKYIRKVCTKLELPIPSFFTPVNFSVQYQLEQKFKNDRSNAQHSALIHLGPSGV